MDPVPISFSPRNGNGAGLRLPFHCWRKPMHRRCVFVLWVLMAAALPAASAADDPGFTCGTVVEQILPAKAGSRDLSKSCQGDHCDKVLYTTFHDDSLEMDVFAGIKTEWLVPSSITLPAADAAALIRFSESLYAYLSKTFQAEPGGDGRLAIAIVPCEENNEGCNATARARLGSKGIEIYYREPFAASSQDLLAELGRFAASSSGDFVLHEMAHNFDLAGSRDFRVHDPVHYWTAVVQYLAFVERYDEVPRRFFEYDSYMLDATTASVGQDYFARYLENIDRTATAQMDACMQAGCDDERTRPLLIALVMRLQALAGGDFLRRFLVLTNAGTDGATYSPGERFFVTASQAARSNLSCVADDLHIGVSAAARTAMASAGAARPQICGAAQADATAIAETGLPEVSLAVSGEEPAEVSVSLPARLRVEFPSGENPDSDDEEYGAGFLQLAIDVPLGHVLRVHACPETDAAGSEDDEDFYDSYLWIGSDTVPQWPESADLLSELDMQSGCDLVRTWIPHRGQTKVHAMLEGSGTYRIDFSAEKPATIPAAVAHIAGSADSRSVAWSFPAGTPLQDGWIQTEKRTVAFHAPTRSLPLQNDESDLIELGYGASAARRVNAALELSAIPILSAKKLEGLWYDPQKPGFGIQVLRGGSDAEPIAIAAIYTYQGTHGDEYTAGNAAWLVGAAPVTTDGGGSLAIELDMPAAMDTYRSAPWGSLLLTPDGEDMLAEYAGLSGLRGYSRLKKLVTVADAPLTGTWYDPAAPGTGWNLMVSPDGQLVATHYRVDSEGNPDWRFGIVALPGSGPVTVPLSRSTGGLFVDRHRPGSSHVQAAGSATFRQVDCDHLELTTTDGGESQTLQLQRLVRHDACGI